ncbi:MAG: hypothetical protein WD426_02835 [Anditalea sp.]
MKKHLFTLCFLAIVQIAFGSDRNMMAPKDSVIIEFGNSGKIILIVDNKEDFEKLKSMDVNQIIKELDLELDEETGELTVVEIRHKDGNKEIIRVHEDGPETRVSVGRLKVIVDESGSTPKVKLETIPKDEEDPDFRTYFNLDLGINNYFEDGAIPGGEADYSVKSWGSWNVGINWMASQKLQKGRYWDFGMGVQWYNFKFANKGYQAINGDYGVEFINRTDVYGFKSKISASYLTALTLLRWDFGKMNDNDRNGLRVAVGPYAGYRLGGRSKFVYREQDGSGRRKIKEPIGSNLNNFRYGLRGEVGFRSITFFTTYDFNTLLQKDRGPSLHPVAFGLVF